MLSESEEQVLEQYKTKLEKIMMELPSEISKENHLVYLSGYIDALHDSDRISKDIRRILYSEYCF